MHLGAIFLHHQGIGYAFDPCLLSLAGGYAFGPPFSRLRLKAPLFRGDMAPPQWGMHLYVAWDYMHLEAISPHIPSGGYESLFRGSPLFCLLDAPSGGYGTP